MAEPNPNPTARDDEQQVLFNATRHEHELLLFEGLPAYTCSGCKEYGANKGYKCKISSGSNCENFTLHEVCAAVPDAIQHPFRSDVIIKFRSKTFLRHHCSACREVMKGFVFETERHNTKLHPLCMALPKILDYGRHANHKLNIVTGDLKGKAYTCSACDGYIRCGGWRYQCEDVACKVYVDPSCAKNDIFGLSEHGIHRVASVGPSTSGDKRAGLVQSIISGAGGLKSTYSLSQQIFTTYGPSQQIFTTNGRSQQNFPENTAWRSQIKQGRNHQQITESSRLGTKAIHPNGRVMHFACNF